MPHRQVETEIAALNLLRQAPAAEALPAIRKALTGRVNLIVAKAAQLAAELRLHDLIPDLLSAFDRLFENPVQRDPQCWGKNAISKTLAALEYSQSAPFVRGLHHIQMEPVWRGEEDTAATLRGTSALALPACADLARAAVLRHLVDALADRALPVRSDAARAIAQMAGDEAVLILRLKARLGDDESQLSGEIFDHLFQLEPHSALSFVATFLQPHLGPTAQEAALALGACRLPEAVPLLRHALATQRDPAFQPILLRALSATRQPEALDFLYDMVRNARQSDALGALEALALHRASPDIRLSTERAVRDREPSLQSAFRQSFSRPENA